MDLNPTFIHVTTSAQIQEVASLADEIWRKYYVPLIGQAQVDYMLDTLQSASAIRAQIENGYLYYTMIRAPSAIGYLALVPNAADASVQLSKIYLKAEECGKGLGRALLSFAEERGVQLGMRSMWLTVNKYNAVAIGFYQRQGFIKTAALVQDIGHGFVMDDFRMDKALRASP